MKKTADKWFSKFIRLRDSRPDNGGGRVGKCCTCGAIIQVIYDGKWNPQAHAGHCITRNRESTRYDERNVHLQCVKCNTYESGRESDHAVYIDNLYGNGTHGKLVAKSHVFCKRMKHDYKMISDDYRIRVKDMM